MIYGVPLAGEVKRNGRDYGNHCKLEIYTGNCFLDMGKLLFQRNENIICLMGNSVSITINIYFFFLCIILRITFSFY